MYNYKNLNILLSVTVMGLILGFTTEMTWWQVALFTFFQMVLIVNQAYTTIDEYRKLQAGKPVIWYGNDGHYLTQYEVMCERVRKGMDGEETLQIDKNIYDFLVREKQIIHAYPTTALSIGKSVGVHYMKPNNVKCACSGVIVGVAVSDKIERYAVAIPSFKEWRILTDCLPVDICVPTGGGMMI